MTRWIVIALVAVSGCAAKQRMPASAGDGPAPRVVLYLDWHGRTLYLFEPDQADRAIAQGLIQFRLVAGSDEAVLTDDTGKTYSFRVVRGPDRTVLALKPHYGTQRIVLGADPVWEPGFSSACSIPNLHQRAALMTPSWAKGFEWTQYDVKRVRRLGSQLFREKWDITRIGFWYDTPDCRGASRTGNYRGRPEWLIETRSPQ